MKKHSSFIAVICALVALAGCSKVETEGPGSLSYETKGAAEVVLAPINTDQTFVVVGSEKIFSFTELMSSYQDKDLLNALFLTRALYNIDSYLTKYEFGRYYKAVTIKYPSIDPQGNKIWLSGRIYMSCDYKGRVKAADHIVLSNHYTIGSSAEAPSQVYTFDAPMAINKGLVVAPDYNGYGLSEDNVHPYLCGELTAINSIDMIRAAKGYMAQSGKAVSASAPVYNLGYSQGGYSTLATQRYIEEHSNLLKEFPLKNTYCGGGVYSPKDFFQAWLNGSACQYPTGILLIVRGLKYAFPDIMTAPIEAYFSDAINASDALAKVDSKDYTVDEIATTIKAAIGECTSASSVAPSKIFSAEAMTPGSALYTQLLAALDKNEIIDGWTPRTPVHFMHCVKDETVPYAAFTRAKNAYAGNANAYFENVDYLIISSHRTTAGLFYARSIAGEYKKVKSSAK